MTSTTKIENSIPATGPSREKRIDVEYWYGRVLAYCQCKLISTTDAEDAAQETFLRGFARIDDLESCESMGSWLRSISHHVCVDMIRRHKVRRSSTQDVESLSTAGDHMDPSRKMIVDDERAQLVRLIHELPESLRETILLHYYEKMSYDEIAKWLDVARSTVNERLSKARSHLRYRLLDAGGENHVVQ